MPEHANPNTSFLTDAGYDNLVKAARRYLPAISVLLIVIAGVCTQLGQVPGMGAATAGLATVSGICMALSWGINELLKRAKDQWNTAPDVTEAQVEKTMQ